MAIDPLRKNFITNPWHSVANHAYGHTCIECDPEVNALEERERRAERVASNGDRRYVVLCECLFDAGEDRGCGSTRRFFVGCEALMREGNIPDMLKGKTSVH